MSEPKNETNPELDCQVTVNDGAYMTCDMIEDDPQEDEEIQPEYIIQRLQYLRERPTSPH